MKTMLFYYIFNDFLLKAITFNIVGKTCCFFQSHTFTYGLSIGSPKGRKQILNSSLSASSIKKKLNWYLRVVLDINRSNNCSITANLSKVETILDDVDLRSYGLGRNGHIDDKSAFDEYFERGVKTVNNWTFISDYNFFDSFRRNPSFCTIKA